MTKRRRPKRNGRRHFRPADPKCPQHGHARAYASYDAATRDTSKDDQPWWCPLSGRWHAGHVGSLDAWRFYDDERDVS